MMLSHSSADERATNATTECLRLLYVERFVFLPMRWRTYKNSDVTVGDDRGEPYSNRFLRISSLAGRTRTGL